MSNKFRKRDIVILTITAVILVAIVVFCVLNWNLVVELFNLVVRGKEIVHDYIASLGIPAAVAICLMIMFCFFFPVFSSLPLQILCLMAYDVVFATLLISLAFALASQLLFLLEKNFKTFFYSQKQRDKQHDVEERIKNSKRNIDLVMILLYIVPCIPFLVISSVACRSNMKWWKYTLYTALGPIPEVAVTLLVGNQITSNSSPVVSMIVLVFMVALVVLSLIFKDKMIYFIFKPKDKTKEEIKND